MKKIIILSALFCGFFGFVPGAWAECVIESCGGRGDDCINAYDMTVDPADGPAENEVYICEKGHCDNGTIIHDPALEKFYMCVIASNAGVNFMGMGNDTWEPYNVRTCVNPKDGYISQPDPNATKALRNSTNSTETLRKVDTGSIVLGVGQNICIEYKCNPGFMPNTDKTECVPDTRGDNCTQTGGTWVNNACVCNSAKGLKKSVKGNFCECSKADFAYDRGQDKCLETQAAIDKRNRDAAQQRAQACQNSGGTWRNNQCVCDSGKNLKTQNHICVCLDATHYKRVGDRCELTDAAALQRECEETTSQNSGAYWDASSQSCLCTNPQHVWIKKICQINPAIAACNRIYGAAWNNTDKVCYCTDPNKEMNAAGTACVESSAARERREAASAELTITKSKNKIKETSKKLMSMAEDFDRTVWKTEEGKFNSTRLLSDSVAGVVLGTAGGLITSNVIKKNQVSNGFEDIQCTVGGQVVAGWGDEFRVGIQ